MSKPSLPETPDSLIALRRMKLLIVLLIITNLGTGIYGAYLLRDVDRRYSELIDKSVPPLNDLRELLADVTGAMLATNPAHFGTAPADNAAPLRRLRTAVATEQEFRAGALAGLAPQPATRDALQAAGAAFDQTAGELAALYAAGDKAAAATRRDQQLRPAFDAYLAAIAKAADGVETRSLALSRDYTADTRRFSTIVLGAASWPVFALLGLVVFVVALLLVLVFVFRGHESADSP
ncbi:MAG: hypothetical protein RLZZ15_2750 [Verrucomicrobiota bacterium]|jgi:hypothetical protein